jgi:predicted nucleotidyltransferase component of viral defense system
MTAERYLAQVQLLLRAIPEIAREKMFALKGGTAINLFVRNLPRLSVDIDLVYLPVANREQSLNDVRNGMDRVGERLERLGYAVGRQLVADGKRVIVYEGTNAIKIEVSPVLRGTVFEPQLLRVTPAVEDRFGFAEMTVVSMADLYAGKIAAALDRQHPRDLFDVHFLFENEGIDENLFRAFLIYLVSHNRPAVELLDPHFQHLEPQYDAEFVGMTIEDVPLDVLVRTRERLVAEIQKRVKAAESKRFLLSFQQQEPDWAAIGFDSKIAELPAIGWKLVNLDRLATKDPEKFHREFERLKDFLG